MNRTSIVVAALLVLSVARVAAEEQILFPQPDEGMAVRLDQALERQLAARWHEAIRVYQPLLSDPAALEVLVPFAVRDPLPALLDLRAILRRVAAGKVDFEAGPAVGDVLILTAEECARAARILEDDGPVGLYRVLEREGIEAQAEQHLEVVHVSVAEYVRLQIARFPAEGLAVYRGLYDPTARDLYQAAAAGRDLAALDRLAAEYLLTSYGPLALDRRAELAYEAGDFQTAVRAWRRLLRLYPDPADAGLEPALLMAQLGAAYARSGRRRALVGLIDRAAEGTAVTIGGQEVDLLDFLRRQLDGAAEESPAEAEGEHPSSAEAGFESDLIGPLRPRWNQSLATVMSEFMWTRSTEAEVESPYRYLPAVAGGRLFLSGQAAVVAFDLGSGQEHWRARSEVRLGPRVRLENDQEPLYGPIAAGGLCLSVLDHFADVTLRSQLLVTRYPVSALYAHDQATGLERWRQPPAGGTPAFDVLGKVFLVGPPVVVGDRVFVSGTASHRETDVHVFAFDLATGEPLWQRYVCSIVEETERDEKEQRRMAPMASPLTAAHGVLYLSTNLGLAAALSADSGRVLWMARYRRPYEGKHFKRFAPQLETDPGPPWIDWTLSRPAVVDDRLYLVPTDVRRGMVRVLDAETGVWQAVYARKLGNTDYRHVLGTDSLGRIFLGGNAGLCFDPGPVGAGDPQVVWRTAALHHESRARGGVGRRSVYLPGRRRGGGADVLYLLDRASGAVVEEIARPSGGSYGNLLIVETQLGPVLVSVTDDEVAVLEGKRP